MSVVIDAPRASAPDRLDCEQGSVSPQEADRLDPVIASALQAGRQAGKRLTRTPLTPRQCAVVTSVMGGGAR